MTSIKRLALLISSCALLGSGNVSAQVTFNFEPFEIQGVSHPSDLEYIDINGLVASAFGGVRIGIFNDSAPGDGWVTGEIPTITSIVFEDQANVLTGAAFESAAPGVTFAQNNNITLPGGNAIGFDVEAGFRAANPQVKKGLDPGEWAYFTFTGSNYLSVVAAIESGDVRIGLHVQEIGKRAKDSASFVNTTTTTGDGGGGSGDNGGPPDVIPEPSSALLTLLGAAFLLRRKR